MDLKHTSLEEGRRFYWVNNVLAVLLVVGSVVVIGVYA